MFAYRNVVLKNMSPFSLDEIVFENRNKEYGAYSLRKTYVRNVLIGLGISLFLSTSFCLYFVYDNFLVADDLSFSPEMLKFAQYNIDEELLKATELEPIKEKIKEIPQPQLETKQKEIGSTSTVTVIDEKEVVKVIDSVALKDSIDKANKDKIEAEQKRLGNDTIAKFAGGTEDVFRNFLVTRIRYPDTTMVRLMKGKLTISFIVNQKGELENITIDKFANTQWGKNIITAVKTSPPWQPAYKNGKPVKMIFMFPVYFAQ